MAGDATILADLDANGSEGQNVAGVLLGKLGGGYRWTQMEQCHLGAGSGPSFASADSFQSAGAPFKGWVTWLPTFTGGQEPGGGSYGGVGGRPEAVGGQATQDTLGASGKIYGDADLTNLFGGSGGGGGNDRQGGSGAGAIKIVSTGTLTIGGNIWACGGRGGARSNEARRSGGSGSGGSIYLKASNIVINSGVQIRANGGAGATGVDTGNNSAKDGGGAGPAEGTDVWKPPPPSSTTQAPPMRISPPRAVKVRQQAGRLVTEPTVRLKFFVRRYPNWSSRVDP